MLFPATSQQDNQSMHSALPDAFHVKTLSHFTAEFLSGTHSGHRQEIRTLELPLDMSPPSGELQADAVQLGGCRTTETGKRAEKLRHFAQDCSWAIEHVYFGGDGVAQDKGTLDAHGITHVVNCVRLEVQNYFDQRLHYLGLFLQDSGKEDILAVLYDVFDFIEESKQHKGNVFVHCSQGVSRSAAIVIAYVMWRKKQNFWTTKEELKERRGVVDPNVNFCSQLIFWDKRFHTTPDGFLRIYRMASQSGHQPSYLVPKQEVPPQNSRAGHSVSTVFDPRGTFVIHGPEKVFIWIGSGYVQPYLDSARRFAQQLSKYEDAPVAEEVTEGMEPTEFFDVLTILSHSHCMHAQEQEAYTPDYKRFSQSYRHSSSLREGSRSSGANSSLRRVLSEI